MRSTLMPQTGSVAVRDFDRTSHSEVNSRAHRDLVLGGARERPLPSRLRHDCLHITLQRVGDLRLETPVALAVHLEAAAQPISQHGLTFGSAAHEMLNRVGTGLLAGFEPCAGVAARRSAELCAARDEEIIVREAETSMATIGDRAKLALIDETGLPHGGRSRRVEVETKISILVHGELTF